MTRDTRPYVVLLGPHPAQVDHARRAGVGIVLLDTVANLDPDVAQHADHVLATDYTDADRVAHAIATLCRGMDVRGVLALTEKGLLPSARMNQLLGAKDNAVEVVRRVMDKRLMREHLAGLDRFALPAREVDSPRSLGAFAREVGTPVIVKPADGAGSVGVRVFRDLADLSAWTPQQNGTRLLAEKFVEGREVSVEALSVDGRHLIAAVTEKFVARSSGANEFVEVGHAIPARLGRDTEASLRAFVRDFLDHLGLRQGLSHTEVIIGADGPAIVETHTRNGGDHIADLVLLSTGLDLRDLALRHRCGDLRRPPADPERVGGAAIRYLTPPPGVVEEVRGLAAARYLPGVVDLQIEVGPGDTVRPLASSFDRVGYVIATGADPGEANQRCLDALAAVSIRVRPAAGGSDAPGADPERPVRHGRRPLTGAARRP